MVSMYRKISILYFILVLTAALPVSGQSLAPESFTLPFSQVFTRNDYNASTQNWIVKQDRRGVIYVGNGLGILEYNGSDWRLIPIDNNTTVRAMTISGDSTLFVAGINEIGYLSPDSLGLLHYQSLLPYIQDEDLEFNTIWFAHSTTEGVYFQGGDHLFRWNGTEMYVWRPPTRFNTSGMVHNTLYVHSYGEGLMRVEGDSLVLIPGSERFSEEWVFVLLPYDEDTVLLGTRDQGFFLYDGRVFEAFPTEVDEFLQTYTLYLPGALLSDGTIALGTSDAGLLVIDRSGRLLHHVNRTKGLPDEQVFYVFPDSEQGLWLTLNNGIVRLNMPSPISFINAETGGPEDILTLASYNETVYIGGWGGLYYVDKELKRIAPVEAVTRRIWNLLSTPDALFGTTIGGLYRIEGQETSYWSLFQEQETQDYEAFSLNRSQLDSTILFIGLRNGFDILRIAPEDKTTWDLVGRVEEINTQVNTIHETSPGQLFLGTEDGVLRLTYSTSDWLSPQITSYGEDAGLPSGAIWGYEAAQTLFFTTTDGLYTFNAERDLFERADSLFPGISFQNSSAFGSLIDGWEDELWIASEQGPFYALPDSSGTFQTFGAPFLQVADWTINVFDTTPDSIAWLGGINGLVRYDARTKKSYDNAPAPLIRQVIAGSDSLVFGGMGAPLLPPNPTSTVIEYAKNTVRFDYMLPAFDMPERVQYQSKLEGFDQNWSNWTSDTWREYTNIPQGQYTFLVKAKNAYGYTSNISQYPVKVNPPWWATPFAYFIFTIASLGVLLGLGAVQRKSLLARERVRAELEKADALKDMNQELQKTLAHLTETQDQLIHAEKMASLGQLTAGIAHEIKNPLNFIQNFSSVNHELSQEALEELKQAGDAKVIHDLLNDIGFNAQKVKEYSMRADKIVQSMLAHSRAHPGERLRTDLNDLLREYANLSYHGMRVSHPDQPVHFEVDLDPNVGDVSIIPQEIGRVILNILDNAFYAVHARNDRDQSSDQKPAITLRSRRAEDHVVITIQDNGTGIAPDVKEKIFEPFFTTKPSGSGTGLGLSLSYDMIVNGHQGDISVESSEAQGTLFTITLPVEGIPRPRA